LPEPDDGEADSQDALDDTDHETFAVTATEVDEPLADGTVHEAKPIVNESATAPGCDTDMVLVMPAPVNVRVPDRDEVEVFAVAEIVTV